MRVLGLSGSLRRESHNRKLLLAAAAELPGDAELEVCECLGAIPPYSEDAEREDVPEPVTGLRSALTAADAIIIATPEYNGSIPGLLKNALDWASRPFPDNALRDKPVAVIGASTGLFGAVWAQADLRRVLERIGARVVDEELPVARAHEAFNGEGGLTDPQLRQALTSIVATALEGAERRAGQAEAP